MTKFLEELGCAMKFKGKEIELEKGDTNGLLYNKLYSELELAKKYKSNLKSLIRKSMIQASYTYDFYYVNYDKRTNTYYLEYFNQGHRDREKISKKRAKEYGIGAIYTSFNHDEYMHKDDSTLNYIAYRVENKLKDMGREDFIQGESNK